MPPQKTLIKTLHAASRGVGPAGDAARIVEKRSTKERKRVPTFSISAFLAFFSYFERGRRRMDLFSAHFSYYIAAYCLSFLSPPLLPPTRGPFLAGFITFFSWLQTRQVWLSGVSFFRCIISRKVFYPGGRCILQGEKFGRWGFEKSFWSFFCARECSGGTEWRE